MVEIKSEGRARVNETMSQGNHARARKNKGSEKNLVWLHHEDGAR